jgi:hypothetical protein
VKISKCKIRHASYPRPMGHLPKAPQSVPTSLWGLIWSLGAVCGPGAPFKFKFLVKI